MGDHEEYRRQFERASSYARLKFQNSSDEDMLRLYGLYKQAIDGPCTAPKPYFYEFVAKAKWEAWKKLGDMSQVEAMLSYISLVKALDPNFDECAEVQAELADPGKPARQQFGVAVSTMYGQEVATELSLSDDEKTVFDWCKEGNVKKLVSALDGNPSLLNAADEQGLTLLHWASDRGFSSIVEYLLKSGADVNAQDQDMQGPLHYAVTCDRSDIAVLLLQGGADLDMPDGSGQTPFQLAENLDLRTLIAGFRDRAT